MIFLLMEVEMILDNYVDNRMMKLYEILTNTDFKGNIKDERVISLLYTMRCIDKCINEFDPIDRKYYILIAKEINRLYSTCEERQSNNVSIMAWTRAMLKCLKEKDLKYKQIHKMNTYDLSEMVSEYIE